MRRMPHAPMPFVVIAVVCFLALSPAVSAAGQASAPVAVLDAPATVPYGHDITVSGARSSSLSAIIVKYIWTLDEGLPIETAAPACTFAADPARPFAVGPHIVRLVVVDSAGLLSAPDSATVRVIDNIAPTAVLDAPATVAFGADLRVSGARSTDVGGTIVRYVWSLDGGPTFETADPSFTFVVDPARPLTLGNHLVRLVVVDDAGNVSAPASATVRVVDNAAPTAVVDAPATVGFGQSITVSGARSTDVGGTIVRYEWTLDAGVPIETADPTFTFVVDPASPLALGNHIVRLVVVDDAGNVSAPATATVRVIDNIAPTAVLDAPATVAFGLGFTVSGARSADVGGAIVRYEWTLDARAPIETADPTFTFVVDPASPLALGNHVVRHVVVDDAGNGSAPAEATVRVVDSRMPTAVIDAPATVPFGGDITVSGARSVDIDGSIARYRWTLDGGVPFETASPAFTFICDPVSPFATGSHVIELVVVDDAGNLSAPDSAVVRVIDNLAPTAVLDAPATAGFGRSFTVSGARSVDVGGRIVEYRWRLDGGGAAITIDPAFTFVVDPASPLGLGEHVVQLVVVDDSGNVSAPDSATVRVVDDVAPTAVIDAPATIGFGANLVVSGARSSDVGGVIVRYAWSLDGQAPVISADPAFTFVPGPASPLAPGPHLVQLVVTDDSGNASAPATATVRVIDDVAPTAVIDAPASIIYGADLTVSGARSSDVGGRIASYAWSLDGQAPVISADSAFTFAGGPAGPLGPGPHVVQLVVTDDSGNASLPASATVEVRYRVTGFFPPVYSLPAVNRANAGRTVPVRWRLSGADGRPVTSLASFVSLMSAPIRCGGSPGEVMEAQMVPADGGPVRYDPAEGQFIFNWRTPRTWDGCRLLRLTLADGSRTYAMFSMSGGGGK